MAGAVRSCIPVCGGGRGFGGEGVGRGFRKQGGPFQGPTIRITVLCRPLYIKPRYSIRLTGKEVATIIRTTAVCRLFWDPLFEPGLSDVPGTDPSSRRVQQGIWGMQPTHVAPSAKAFDF